MSDIGYSIHHSPHGVYVRGEMLVTDFCALAEQWRKQGYNVIDMGLNEVLRATFVITSKTGAVAWRKELGVGSENADWLLSGDTGISSKTIYAVLAGGAVSGRNADVPHDPDDFGRCYRLLKRFPAWRERLPEVAEKFPAWGPMVREWDQMTALYERDVESGRCRELFDLMRSLEREGGRKGPAT